MSKNKNGEIIKKSVSVKPDSKQLAWQELEFTCFIHFGVNTFTSREWGDGLEDPKIFNPSCLDTDQWCRIAQAAGMRLILLTVKHHDGFSLWRDGQGDVLKDLSLSCQKHGLKLGVYLSPADLYQIEHPQGVYGNQSRYSWRQIPRPVSDRPFANQHAFYYQVDDYNEYFMNQLFELLTEYGPIHQIWFDGAHPKQKGGQQYVYQAWYDLIRHLAPEAVISIKGPDVRWCGNEAGHTRPSEWSVIPIGGPIDTWQWPDMQDNDLGSLEKLRQKLKDGGNLHWYPAETNTSIRDGWFWRDEEQYVKSTEEILDIWYRSVGGNTVFLLNVPPDRRGLFASRDCQVLESVGSTICQTFSSNLAAGATVEGSLCHLGFEASKLVDEDPQSCWMATECQNQAELTIQLSDMKTFNRVLLQEPIGNYSQRISHFAVDAESDGNWIQLIEETTIGYKRICRIPQTTAQRLRIRVLASRLNPALSNFGIYLQPKNNN